MHWKQPQDGNGRVSRLLASVPLVRAGYPFINIRAHKREEYLQTLFTVSYCGIHLSNDLKISVSRRKLRQIYSLWWMHLHLRCLTPLITYDPCLQLRRKTSSIDFQLILESPGCLCKTSDYDTIMAYWLAAVTVMRNKFCRTCLPRQSWMAPCIF